MSQIQEDLRPAGQAPRRTRRRVLLASALTGAVAATAAAVVIGTGGSGGSGGGSPTVAPASLSGQQILLAAASTAEHAPTASGTYWHVRTVETNANGGGRTALESWTRRDGRVWWKGGKTQGKVVKLVQPAPFRLGGPPVSFEQLQKLPADQAALKAWITAALKRYSAGAKAGPPDAATRNRLVFDGLVSLVAQLPAPPKVRAAAFRAIAAYPNVKNLGAVKGGRGLAVSFPGARTANLVLDSKTARITDTDYFVSAEGAEVTNPGGITIAAGWTNVAPR